MIDLEQKDLEVQQRVTGAVSAVRGADSADAINEEVLDRTCQPPWIFTLIVRKNARRKSVGSKTQVHELEVRVGIVTDSKARGMSGALKGTSGSYQVRGEVLKTLHGWLLPGTLRELSFLDEDFIGRRSSRVLYEQIYTTEIEETFT